MVNEKLRVRIKQGENEIEVEGDRENVDHYVERFFEASYTKGKDTQKRTKEIATGKRQRKTSKIVKGKPERVDLQIAVGIVNYIKKLKNFETLLIKIIRPGNIKKAILMVFFYQAEKEETVALSSGDVDRALKDLKVKVGAGTVSKYCSGKIKGISEFLLKEPRPGKSVYKISEQGKEVFKSFLEVGEGTEEGE